MYEAGSFDVYFFTEPSADDLTYYQAARKIFFCGDLFKDSVIKNKLGNQQPENKIEFLPENNLNRVWKYSRHQVNFVIIQKFNGVLRFPHQSLTEGLIGLKNDNIVGLSAKSQKRIIPAVFNPSLVKAINYLDETWKLEGIDTKPLNIRDSGILPLFSSETESFAPAAKTDPKFSTAFLFTGNYRSFDKTYQLIEQNLLRPNNSKIFVYCETEMNYEELYQKISSKIDAKYIGEIVAVKTSKTIEYYQILDYILRFKPAISKEIFAEAAKKDNLNWTQSYLSNSGTIIQYYQFMKCMKLMIDYERTYNVKFDLCVRSRLDLIISQELNLVEFFTQQNHELSSETNLEAYVRSLGNDYLYDWNLQREKCFSNYVLSPVVKDFEDRNLNIHLAINSGDYLWSLGIDQVWIAKRHVFNYLYGMVYFFGDYINYDNHCTFNSETFFTQHLHQLGIKQFLYLSPNDNIFNHDYLNTHGPINSCSSFISIIRQPLQRN